MNSARTGLAVAAAFAAAASASVDAAASTVTAADFSGGSSLSGGVFSFQSLLPTPVSGSALLRDLNLDGVSDLTQNNSYDAPALGLAGPSFLLYIDDGGTTAFHSSGALSGTFDWAMTGYEGAVAPNEGLPSCLGSAMFGTATFLPDKTILHINEGLLWADGLFSGGWAGYKLSGLTDLELTQTANGYAITTLVPAPAGLAAFGVLGAMTTKRRRR